MLAHYTLASVYGGPGRGPRKAKGARWPVLAGEYLVRRRFGWPR